MSKAATEFSKNICSFLPRAPFFWIFPGGFMFSPITDTNFPGKCMYLFVNLIGNFQDGIEHMFQQ